MLSRINEIEQGERSCWQMKHRKKLKESPPVLSLGIRRLTEKPIISLGIKRNTKTQDEPASFCISWWTRPLAARARRQMIVMDLLKFVMDAGTVSLLLSWFLLLTATDNATPLTVPTCTSNPTIVGDTYKHPLRAQHVLLPPATQRHRYLLSFVVEKFRTDRNQRECRDCDQWEIRSYTSRWMNTWTYNRRTSHRREIGRDLLTKKCRSPVRSAKWRKYFTRPPHLLACR